MNAQTCVLVVDDDRNDIFLLRRGFHRAGLTTDFLDVPDGVLALEYLRGDPPYDDRSQFPFPNLILLDLKMPRINGLEVLAWLATRRHLKNLPVLVLTSSTLPSDREKATRLGAHEFLVKPTEPSDWVKLAQELHERWLGRYETAEQTWREAAASEHGPLTAMSDHRNDVADAAVRGGLFG